MLSNVQKLIIGHLNIRFKKYTAQQNHRFLFQMRLRFVPDPRRRSGLPTASQGRCARPNPSTPAYRHTHSVDVIFTLLSRIKGIWSRYKLFPRRTLTWSFLPLDPFALFSFLYLLISSIFFNPFDFLWQYWVGRRALYLGKISRTPGGVYNFGGAFIFGVGGYFFKVRLPHFVAAFAPIWLPRA